MTIEEYREYSKRIEEEVNPLIEEYIEIMFSDILKEYNVDEYHIDEDYVEIVFCSPSGCSCCSDDYMTEYVKIEDILTTDFYELKKEKDVEKEKARLEKEKRIADEKIIFEKKEKERKRELLKELQEEFKDEEEEEEKEEKESSWTTEVILENGERKNVRVSSLSSLMKAYN